MKYKVLHIITRLDKGGSAENTLLTILGLSKERYDMTLIKGASLESTMSDEERRANEKDLKKISDSGVSVITIDELVRKISSLNDLRAFIKLFLVIRNGKYHIVHTHTSKAGVLGRWAAWFCRTPVIIHTPHGHVFYGYYGRFVTQIFKIMERVTALVTDRIITLTDREKQEHINSKIAPPEKFITIHSGVDTKRFFGVAVAGTKEFKIQNYIGIKFIIMGDGPLMTYLKREANSLGISDSVIFAGWRADVPAVMSVFDIFVLPSLNEGMGRVLVEAMLLKKPIIASNVGGIPDLIRNGENGILIPPASPDKLAEAIIDLIKSKDKRNRMGERGRFIAESYSDKAMVEEIENLYEEVLSACRHCMADRKSDCNTPG